MDDKILARRKLTIFSVPVFMCILIKHFCLTGILLCLINVLFNFETNVHISSHDHVNKTITINYKM